MEEHHHVCDICIVCAMYEEAEAVLDEFSARCSVSFKSAFSQMSRYAYCYATIRNKRKEPLSVLVTWPSDRGPVQTGLNLSLILQEFRPRFAAMTGICAGDRKKVKLGDLTTVALLFGEEQGSLPGSSTRQAARRDELAEPQQPAPTRQWSAPGREQDAGWRRGYGCADAPARPLS